MNLVIKMHFKIAHLTFDSKTVLAPMAGVSNRAYREIARLHGAGLVFAEMVSDKGLIYQNDKTINLLQMSDQERPLAQQLFGSNMETMVEAALFIDRNSRCDLIDINMGCPVPKVALRAQAGAALMKNPDYIYEIVKAIVSCVSKPVTVKIRSGWDNQSINAVEVAKKIEAAGAKAITVHARTRAQGYGGLADLEVIKQVKEAVSIPVIGNGDVIDGPSAKKMLDYTKCDAVMIGRAALGNPWIFKEVNAYLNQGVLIERPTYFEVKNMMLKHFRDLVILKGEKIAALEMRSHGPWYVKGIPGASKLRGVLSRITSYEMFEVEIESFFKTIESQE
jgi:tRNA-dihydrouridine synthase B